MDRAVLIFNTPASHQGGKLSLFLPWYHPYSCWFNPCLKNCYYYLSVNTKPKRLWECDHEPSNYLLTLFSAVLYHAVIIATCLSVDQHFPLWTIMRLHLMIYKAALLLMACIYVCLFPVITAVVTGMMDAINASWWLMHMLIHTALCAACDCESVPPLNSSGVTVWNKWPGCLSLPHFPSPPVDQCQHLSFPSLSGYLSDVYGI